MSSGDMTVIIFLPLLVYSEFEQANRASIKDLASTGDSTGFPSEAPILANFSAIEDSIIPGNAV